MIPNNLIEKLRSTQSVVFFTGAGVSSESGIPTFRDALTGLWAQFDAEKLATRQAFQRDPELVWGWYEWRRMQVQQADPNPGHRAIVALEAHFPQVTVITQNVDDLHERAGSHRVIHLHGSLFAPRCFDCERPHALSATMLNEPAGGRRWMPPACPACHGHIRPGVVWFNEALPERAWQAALEAVMHADLLFVVGTSGLVWPAADLPYLAHRSGALVVQVNPIITRSTSLPTWAIEGKAGAVLPALVERLAGAIPVSCNQKR